MSRRQRPQRRACARCGALRVLRSRAFVWVCQPCLREVDARFKPGAHLVSL
jgi:ribosomal protein L37AE/L43A